jgi:hypothetical protein
MQIAMDAHEVSLFKSFLNLSERYLEFGSGGSTWLASRMRKGWIISVDSAREWLANVASATKDCVTRPQLIHVDIGRLREWGFPADREKQNSWPQYHEDIWQRPESRNADLYFIDGRFRVACFVQCLLHSTPGTFIAIHDFASRPQYHPIKNIAREIARANNMSVFQRPMHLDSEQAQELLHKHRLNPE